MMKRSVALLVGLAVVGCVLAGCVSTKENIIAQHGGDKYQAAKYLKDQGRYQDAVEVFKAFEDERPASVLIPLVYLHVGECQVALQQYQEAVDSFKKAIDKDPTKVGPFAKDALAEAEKLLTAQKEAEAKAAADAKAAEEAKAAAEKAEAEAKAKAEADKAAAELKDKEAQKADNK